MGDKKLKEAYEIIRKGYQACIASYQHDIMQYGIGNRGSLMIRFVDDVNTANRLLQNANNKRQEGE